jgi:hypothetical protein
VNTTPKTPEVVCFLPKTGLGNQLFPLMKALVFAHLNKFAVTIVGYHQIRLGPYLRGEKSKRRYQHYFAFEKSIIGEWLDRLRVRNLNKEVSIDEPPVLKLNDSGKVYHYHAIPRWNDFFAQLKNHRRLVIELLWKALHPDIHSQLALCKVPVIGVHIRMGDFKKLRPDQDFKTVGATRTPEQYFIDVINGIRAVHGRTLPVSVFTDGYRYEFENIFKQENVSLVEGNNDIVDLLLLSKSKIIVTSAGSTFSYWAGFLSDAPIIMHPDHIHEPLRDNTSEGLYEGVFDTGSSLLIDSIKNIS